jgi:hypothetical protein
MKTFENGLPLAGFTTGVIAAGSTSMMCPLIEGVIIVGVVGGIAPFNFPLILATKKVALALAAGRRWC